MTSLTERARAILDRMTAGRRYAAAELMSFAPDVNIDALREVMHELWLAYEVERVGDAAWQRVAPPGRAGAVRDVESLRVAVKPDELFDHDSFAGWFK